MGAEEFYLIEIATGSVLKRWQCGHLSRSEKGALRHKLREMYHVYDPDSGIDLRWSVDDDRTLLE